MIIFYKVLDGIACSLSVFFIFEDIVIEANVL